MAMPNKYLNSKPGPETSLRHFRHGSGKGLLLLSLILTALLVSASGALAQNCEKLMGPAQSWRSLPCDRLKQSYMLPIRQLPELIKLSENPLEDTMELLGLPFHIYNYEGRTICFFRPEAFVSIAYNEKTEMPDVISFDFVGVMRAEEIPESLGFPNALPPQITAESLVWDSIGPFTKIEVKYPDLRIDGENIYEVSIHVPPADPPPKKDSNESGRSGRRRR